MRTRLWHYLGNVALATDIEINALTGGSPRHTISLRAAYARTYGHGYKRVLGTLMCRFLGLFQRGHCDRVIEDARRGGRA